DLEAIWALYLSKASYAYYGVILEFLFDLYSGISSLHSKGMLELDYNIEGKNISLNASNKTRVGLIVNSTTSINLGLIDFNNAQDLVRT
ncbi:hypothetical protein, partial [Lactococcus petauri]|uniref:hypothetical protein n=1 Tax=Lactococcus petauri TaxID=1940789 RepID=UPI0021F1433A